jgi:lipopolysaccharide biosynthesis glycosyltransferase
MSTTPLRVAIATDRGYLLQAAVLLRSLNQRHAGLPVEVLLLHDRLSAFEISMLRSAAGEAELLVQDVTHPLDGVRRGRLAAPAFFRLLLPDICPSGWEHVLYLDVDMLIESPLIDLWDQRHDARPVAMVREYGGPHFGSPKGPPWRDLGVAPSTPYFNAGVMLCDLEAWRQADVGQRTLDLLRRFDLPHGDQCALNTIFAGQVQPLEPQWNVTTAIYRDHNHLGVEQGVEALELVRAAPAVLHFNLGWTPRPWEPRSEHPLRQRWTEGRDAILDQHPELTPSPASPRPTLTRAATRLVGSLQRRVLRSFG